MQSSSSHHSPTPDPDGSPRADGELIVRKPMEKQPDESPQAASDKQRQDDQRISSPNGPSGNMAGSTDGRAAPAQAGSSATTNNPGDQGRKNNMEKMALEVQQSIANGLYRDLKRCESDLDIARQQLELAHSEHERLKAEFDQAFKDYHLASTQFVAVNSKMTNIQEVLADLADRLEKNGFELGDDGFERK
ncbi:hypothetical protein PFICI_06486 [Pestalotiopsis fici W106-1]|uniref:Uncharacterized protein n=1 Tax=Pestalotiopsis fici (strain W106-1 / CGMCC3.15140) TaxID=1229662 RepID=W3X623_PESFW|nr:uncharacterized protein PFICI_06486 [Pestalotiopsis fici W106-1]ETS81484.1 hypothetical protein PFICI_06486 [Pestalotiopsis fici W106-1]